LLDVKADGAAWGALGPGNTVTVLSRSTGRPRRGGVGYMELNLLFGISSIGAEGALPDGNMVCVLSRISGMMVVLFWPG
jgi:hypothetical protein